VHPATPGSSDERKPKQRKVRMLDLLFVVIMLGSFGACLAYTIACERL
jgi:hypothetical protein